jgi:hypothetical protein
MLALVIGFRRAGSSAWAAREGQAFHSDNIKFPFRLNAGMKREFVGMALMLLHFLPTLNQRVQGSSPCAPTA